MATDTDPTANQRRELSAFLRARREALKPAAAGQPTAPQTRRRTPGLRREEVAQLCGISTTWYTWLEQGRDIALSPHALARLADTLHLTVAERAYLFELTRKRDPAPPVADATEAGVPPELTAALKAIAAPAYLLDRYWNACGWNDAAAHLFSGWLGGPELNLLRYVFLDQTAVGFIGDWENRARRLLAEFRADTAHYVDDLAIKVVAADLMQESEKFVRFWNTHRVLEREGGERRFDHPLDGVIIYEQVTMIFSALREFKLVMLLPTQR
jgi:transcriptional regulator with XRE-family HTH domain